MPITATSLLTASACGETIPQFACVVLDDGLLYVADPSDADHEDKVIGIALAPGVVGRGAIPVQMAGEVITAINSGSLTQNEKYYVGADGMLTTTDPGSTWSKYMGYARDDRLFMMVNSGGTGSGSGYTPPSSHRRQITLALEDVTNQGLNATEMGPVSVAGLNAGGTIYNPEVLSGYAYLPMSAQLVTSVCRCLSNVEWTRDTLLPMWSAWLAVSQTTNQRCWFGLQANGDISQSDTLAFEGAMFRASTSAGDTNYKTVTYDGTTHTVVDTGVAISTTPRHFKILYESANSLKFYIDGNLVDTRTTNLPTASFYFMCLLTSLDAAVLKKLYIGRMEMESN